MAKGYITVDEARCKGCTLCTSACPYDLVFMAETRLNDRGYHPAELIDPEQRCTGCALCAVMCPDVCITVYREVRRERSLAATN